jgi:hypothetical protein
MIKDENAGVERLVITSAGDLGIGTSSPTTKLTVFNGSSRTLIRVASDLNFSGAYLGTATSLNRGASLELIGHLDGNNSFSWRFLNSQDISGSNDLIFSSSNSSSTYAGLSYTERMRIDTNGNVCIGRTNALNALVNITSASGVASINCGDAADGTAYGMVQIVRANDQPDNKFHLSFVRAGAKIAGMGFLDNSSTFAIQNGSNNTAAGVGLTDGATSWSTVSDERKKNIIGNVEDALTKIANWRTVYYKYKIDEETTPQRVGLIAQDVLATLPEAVSAEDDELKTLQVRYTETVPLLVKAIQEQQAMIETLTTRLNALEGK